MAAAWGEDAWLNTPEAGAVRTSARLGRGCNPGKPFQLHFFCGRASLAEEHLELILE